MLIAVLVVAGQLGWAQSATIAKSLCPQHKKATVNCSLSSPNRLARKAKRRPLGEKVVTATWQSRRPRYTKLNAVQIPYSTSKKHCEERPCYSLAATDERLLLNTHDIHTPTHPLPLGEKDTR